MDDRRIRVLLVEDDEDDYILARDLFSEIDRGRFSLEWAATYEAALAIMLCNQHDAYLVDYRLGQNDGLALLRQAIASGCQAPIILLTGQGDYQVDAAAMQSGAADYLVKGQITTPLLERSIRYAIERKRVEEALRRQARENARLIETLHQQTEELQARNAELDAFAHTVAHDLKNPLSVIAGYADLLYDRHGIMTEAERLTCCADIARVARKMDNIIQELLLLAEVRKAEVDLQPLDMKVIVADARQHLEYMIEARQADIVQPVTWPIVLGYAPWVEEVWVNYLSNAIKYGGQQDATPPAPPRVELGAETQPDGMVRFWVRDNGPGIAPEDQARLFAPFTRLNQARAAGHGLGLSIVRRIVEKLGGQVEVASQPGDGSVFSFTLPEARTG